MSKIRFIGLASCLIFLQLEIASADPNTIRTVAGTGSSSSSTVDEPLSTNIGNPFGVEIGPDDALYITEVSNHRVWRLDRESQKLSIVAGTGHKGYSGDGGPAVNASMNEPYEIRFDRRGNLFVVEMRNHVVRRIDAGTGIISTVAGTGQPGFSGDGGLATDARLSQPHSIALDDQIYLYIADIGNHRIRRVDLGSGQIESLAGDGTKELPIDGGAANGKPVLGPRALFIHRQTMWVALREGHSVWTLDLANNRWTHMAGTGQKGYSGDGGPAREATFNGPKGIAIGSDGNAYVVDTENQAIRLINTRNKAMSTFAGSGPMNRGFDGDGGAATHASLNRPHGICVDKKGRVYVGDSENHRVRLISGE